MTDERRFDLPEEIEEFRRLVREIAEDKIAPRAQEVDETDEWPKDLWEVLVEHGLMGVGYPEEFGGGGGGSLTFAVMTEELSRVSAGVTLTPLVARLGAIPVMLAGHRRAEAGAVRRDRRGPPPDVVLPHRTRQRQRRGQHADEVRRRPADGFRAERHQAVHHRRRRLGRVHGVRDEGPVAPRRRHLVLPRVPRRRRGLVRQGGTEARHPRLADPRGVPRRTSRSPPTG